MLIAASMPGTAQLGGVLIRQPFLDCLDERRTGLPWDEDEGCTQEIVRKDQEIGQERLDSPPAQEEAMQSSEQFSFPAAGPAADVLSSVDREGQDQACNFHCSERI